VAILLQDNETFEGKSNRFQSSPVTWALKIAADRRIPWVVALKKGSIRLYPAKDGVGVGQRGQVETFFELDLELLDATNAAYLGLVFSEMALRSGGSADNLIADSAKYSTSLGERLRDRIYVDVVPGLAKAVAAEIIQDNEEKTPEKLQEAYAISLRILFRLLFQAYAEDRGLLPAGRNSIYDEHSLKSLATIEKHNGDPFDLWKKLSRVWNAIDLGDSEFEVPAYNGGLFSKELSRNLEGFRISEISIESSKLHPILRSLVIDSTEDGVTGAVDFRSLSVREFGTIYEGLLESSLSVANADLTVDKDNLWVPAVEGQEVLVQTGSIYFHSNSGQRKSTGSYYTQALLVDWLISKSLDRALDKHLSMIQNLIDGDEIAQAGKRLFDFRVADIAMGSGHFLVAAVDRIESRFRSFLADQKVSIPRVDEELNSLEAAAKSALGEDLGSHESIESSALLRRQIARRCIYGIDLNPLAVELSRLALWIHTFVPGLPMSSLDHNLVCGNSLTGIGNVREALDVLQPDLDQLSTFYSETEIEKLLEQAGDLYRQVAENSESTKALVSANSEIIDRANSLVEPVKRAFDAALAIRMQATTQRSAETQTQVQRILDQPESQNLLAKLNPVHLPHVFPEVFSRVNPGFDVLLGNPPWEKMVVNELDWWVKYVPGIKSDSYSKTERESRLKLFMEHHQELVREFEASREEVAIQRSAISKGPFDGIGSADIDLYTAFAWRNWQVLRHGGISGLVLPRNTMAGAALQNWRKEVLRDGHYSDVAFLRNDKQWAFQIEPRVTICLIAITKAESEVVTYGGQFTSALELANYDNQKITMSKEALQSLSATSAFVLLASEAEARIFMKLAHSPSAGHNPGKFDYRPYNDLHATQDRKKQTYYVGSKVSESDIPVFAGASFNLWNPSFGEPYGFAPETKLTESLWQRIRTAKRNSPFYQLSVTEDTFPLNIPRVAYRTMARGDDNRTSIACLLPPKHSAVHMATLLLRKQGDALTDAFLLGVLSSRVYDWVLRRWIDSYFSGDLFNNLPIPSQVLGTGLGSRISRVSAILGAVDSRYTNWASECGVEVGSVKTEDEKNELICELDALVALAYGLSAEDVTLIMETFHVGWDFEPHLNRVLEYFEKWSN
jgi:hypothetical protein